jgi:hypothetical protein
MREFMTWRANKYGIELLGWEHIPTGRAYDAVVAWHVFEHVEAPEAALLGLKLALGEGGQLITDSDFHCDDGHPMHHTHPDWAGALARMGFEPISAGVYRERVAVPA